MVTYDLVDYDGELDPHREPRYAQPHHATAAPEAKLIAIRNTMPIRSALHSSTNYFELFMPVGPNWQRQPQIMNGMFSRRYHIDFNSENGNFNRRSIDTG